MYTKETLIFIAQGRLDRALAAEAFWANSPKHLKAAKRATKIARKKLTKLQKKS